MNCNIRSLQANYDSLVTMLSELYYPFSLIGLTETKIKEVTKEILLSLYYALIYSFIIYGLIAWGNTYESTIKPIFILQKKAVRMITFSRNSLEIIKFFDLITFLIAIFMYKLHNQLLPSAFQSFFSKVDKIHSYNTRYAAKQSYYLPKAGTNYGKFNVRFQGPVVWNAIDDDVKFSSISLFLKKK